MAEQLEFYFPKTKSKHMAMPITGKKYPSKGGTVRFGVQASMNGSMSLPKYVKEEEFYDYGFGVDSVVRKYSQYPQKFLDAFYDFDSNPTADTQDDETVAIAYQAWYQKQAENEVLNAEDYGWVITHKDSGLRTDSFRTKSQAEKYRDELKQNKTLRTGMKIVKANSNDEAITPNILNYLDAKEAEEKEEPEVFGGSNYAVKMIKNAQNHLKMVREAESFEAPYGGIGSLFGIGGDTEIGGFSTSELTGSSAIHGDFDSASLNYSGHQNLQVRAETEKVCKFEGCGDMYSPEWYSDDYCTTACANDMIICGKNKPFTYDLKSVSDTLAGQMRTNDSWNDGAYGDFCQSLTEDVDGMEMCNDCDYQQVDYGAEMDELSEDTSIIRNRVGDMVGMVELDENDEDIEKVDVDIKDEDGEMAYEGTLGAETFEAETIHEKGDYRITAEYNYDALMSHYEGMEEDEYKRLEEQADTYGMFYLQVQKKVMGGWETIDSLGGVIPSDTVSLKDLALTEMVIPDGVNFDAETFESQGTNTKMILGITALAVGLGLWKGKEIMSISEKITESIKNMRK